MPIKDPGERVLNFGKHRGEKLQEVPRDYVEWMAGLKGKREYPMIHGGINWEHEAALVLGLEKVDRSYLSESWNMPYTDLDGPFKEVIVTPKDLEKFSDQVKMQDDIFSLPNEWKFTPLKFTEDFVNTAVVCLTQDFIRDHKRNKPEGSEFRFIDCLRNFVKEAWDYGNHVKQEKEFDISYSGYILGMVCDENKPEYVIARTLRSKGLDLRYSSRDSKPPIEDTETVFRGRVGESDVHITAGVGQGASTLV